MKLYRQATLYYLVSAIAFAANLAIYWLLINYGNVNYLWAATIGFVIQNILDYVSERMWVFNRTRVRPMAGYARSLGVALAILGLILFLTYAGVHVFGMNYLWARIFAGLVAGLANFVLDEKITFAL